MKRATAYLGLGSNVGDRIGYLREALRNLARCNGLTLMKLSPVYQTEPVGYEAQEDFYNMVVQVSVALSPADLLATAKVIELEMGRIETVHKGPRTIDIDILLVGDESISDYKLSVPHPRMLEREFVLRPLYDLDPDLWIVPLHISVRDALARTEGLKRVVRIKESIELSEVVNG